MPVYGGFARPSFPISHRPPPSASARAAPAKVPPKVEDVEPEAEAPPKAKGRKGRKKARGGGA